MSGETGAQVPWQRLDRRMIWVDAVQSLLSLAPAGLAFGVLGVEPGPNTVGPVVVIAVLGIVGAARDALRWVKTRYRVTGEYVERRTGLLVRKYRSIRRDRIRSVDTTARLRHRLAGLRVVQIGAGQQQAAGEAALALDAVSRDVAEQLRRDLLPHAAAPLPGEAEPAAVPGGDPAPGGQELARLRWSWIVYNLFSVWAYIAGGGVLWGLIWLAGSFGLDPVGYLADLVDWGRLGWVWWVVLGVVGVGVFGVGVLAVSFVTEHWRFRLVRTQGEDGTVLRTTQGLFKTREVSRDDRRLRGISISEPLLWRWMGVADTDVVSTGLATQSLTPATTILPRGPVSVARQVATAVLAADPLAAGLLPRPRAALRRRCWWAVLVTAAVTGLLAWLAATIAPLPAWVPLLGLVLLPLTLGGAFVAYRALGHALAGEYLVVRSGLVSRATVALQTRAVAGWHLRQSVLQRRLGLASLAATTAAGYGYYDAPDLAADEAVDLAARAVPGLLDQFLVRPESAAQPDFSGAAR